MNKDKFLRGFMQFGGMFKQPQLPQEQMVYNPMTGQYEPAVQREQVTSIQSPTPAGLTQNMSPTVQSFQMRVPQQGNPLMNQQYTRPTEPSQDEMMQAQSLIAPTTSVDFSNSGYQISGQNQNVTPEQLQQARQNYQPQNQYQDYLRYQLLNPYAGGVDTQTALSYGAYNAGQGNVGKSILGFAKFGLGSLRQGLGAYASGRNEQNNYNSFRDQMYNTEQPYTLMQQGGEITNADVMTGQYITPQQDGSVELEVNEMVKNSQTGDVQKVAGETHENGGTLTDLPNGSKVLSDHTKIGAQNAKQFKEAYEISVRATDTFAKVMDKVNKKIGLAQLLDEEKGYLTELEKQTTEKIDITTNQINKDFLAEELQEIEAKKKALKPKQDEIFEQIFVEQEKIPKKDVKKEDFMQDGGSVNPNYIFEKGVKPLLKTDVAEINKATGIEFTEEGANALFRRPGDEIVEQVPQAQRRRTVEDLQNSQIVDITSGTNRYTPDGGMIVGDYKKAWINQRPEYYTNKPSPVEGEDFIYMNPAQYNDFKNTTGYQNYKAGYPTQEVTMFQEGGQVGIEAEIAEALQQGVSPEQILEQLIQEGMSPEQAQSLVGGIVQQMSQQPQEMMQEGGPYFTPSPYAKPTYGNQPFVEGLSTASGDLNDYQGILARMQAQNSSLPYLVNQSGLFTDGQPNLANVGKFQEGYDHYIDATTLAIDDNPYLSPQEKEKLKATALSQKLGFSKKTGQYDNIYGDETSSRAPIRLPLISEEDQKKYGTSLNFVGDALDKDGNIKPEFKDLSDGAKNLITQTYKRSGDKALNIGVASAPVQQLPADASMEQQQVRTQGEVIPRRVTKGALADVSTPFRMSPSSRIAPYLQSANLSRVEPVAISPEKMIAESERNRQAFVQSTAGLPPQIQAATLANYLGQQDAAQADAIYKTDIANQQAQMGAMQVNNAQADKEMLLNQQLQKQFERENFAGMNADEQAWNNYYERLNQDNAIASSQINNLNLMNYMYPNYQTTGANVLFSDSPFNFQSNSKTRNNPSYEGLTEEQKKLAIDTNNKRVVEQYLKQYGK